MQKTKIGISVGMLGAAMYFMGLFSGYMVAVVLAGYILLCEDNEWLKKTAVKAIAVMLVFSFASAVVNMIPSAMNFIDYVLAMFGGRFYVAFISNLVAAVTTAINIVERVLLLILGVKALNQGTVAIPVVDGIINKYMA